MNIIKYLSIRLSELSQTASGSISIYFIGSLIGNAISIISWPIYGRFIKPVEYAPIAILTSVSGLYVSIVCAGVQYPIISEAITDKLGKAVRIGIVWTLLTALIAIIMALFAYIYLYIIRIDYKMSLFYLPQCVYWLLIGGTVLPLITNPVMGFLRATKKPYLYVLISSSPAIIGGLIGIATVLLSKNGALAIGISSFMNGALSLFMCLFMMKGYFLLSGNLSESEDYSWKDFLSISIPYIPHMSFSQLMWNIPRWLLALYNRASDVSFFSMANSILRPISIIFNSLNLAWSPEVIEIKESCDAEKLGNSASKFCFLVGGISCIVVALPPETYALLLGSSWSGIKTFVPCVIINILCMGYYSFPAAIFLKLKRTDFAPKVSLMGLLITAFASVLLGMRLGSIGVAWGLSLGSIVYLIDGCHRAYVQSKIHDKILINLIPIMAIILVLSGNIFIALLYSISSDNLAMLAGICIGLLLLLKSHFNRPTQIIED